MRASLLTLGICVSALQSAALADAPPSAITGIAPKPDTQPVYKSVWQDDGHGGLVHRQSGLSCDAQSGGYARINVHTYDGFGFDISCNYFEVPGVFITLYLTRRHGQSLDDDMNEAKRELAQAYPDAADSADASHPATTLPLPLRRALFSRAGGELMEGIWVGDLGGWTLEYRATWMPSREADAFSQIAALTTLAQQSAGAHLARCAKSSMPARDGVAVDGAKTAMDVAFTASAMVETLPSNGEFTSDPAAQPVEWCAEAGVEGSDPPVLLWHGINADGATVAADRATLVTKDAPLVLDSRADPEFNKIQEELKRTDTPIYTVIRTHGDDTDVLGYFSHRPDGPTLARMISDIVNHKAHATARYNPKTKQITIATPGSH